MTRKEFDRLVHQERKELRRKWPLAPEFAVHEFQVPILIDLVIDLCARIKKLEDPHDP